MTSRSEPRKLTREEFSEMWRAECRQFFEILRAVSLEWRSDRMIGKHKHDDGPALRAAQIQEETYGPGLQSRLRSGALELDFEP